MAIDTTGIGQGVYQLVRQFYPNAIALNYSPEVKGRLVLKGWSVIGKGRLEFDAGWTDLAQSFMAIRKSVFDQGAEGRLSYGRFVSMGYAKDGIRARQTLHQVRRQNVGERPETVRGISPERTFTCCALGAPTVREAYFLPH